MTERERLVELLEKKSCAFVPCENECHGCHNVEMYDDQIESLADYLLDNGVIVPSCKVGDTVYYPVEGTGVIYKTEVYGIGVDGYGDFAINPKEYPSDAITMYGMEVGKTVFLSRKEAEKALAERSKQ